MVVPTIAAITIQLSPDLPNPMMHLARARLTRTLALSPNRYCQYVCLHINYCAQTQSVGDHKRWSRLCQGLHRSCDLRNLGHIFRMRTGGRWCDWIFLALV